eukprot:gnl/MRDRNA2_/MRDRNA2_114733_c0_seq1.p1 gnl/MRDRNA2_/MRDRNA2_114733_c0~~gnl/MRDRNA2_/MRDRNA2_114733_c0_seq1.p1  ORF type:complete len:287 (+),score=86.57 gnl/MRDRNA2_/MRDRNA2_114733_c0_seq1:329-1189(+)
MNQQAQIANFQSSMTRCFRLLRRTRQQQQQQQGQQDLDVHNDVVERLTHGINSPDDEQVIAAAGGVNDLAASTTTTTSTVNLAMQELLSGVDGPTASSPVNSGPKLVASDIAAAPSATTEAVSTTTMSKTTQDPKAMLERQQQKQQLLALHNTIMSKLTNGWDQIDQADATSTTSVTVSATTVTTTRNLALARLLSGVDGTASEPKLADIKKADFLQTTTTTSTSTTQTIGDAGKKTIAFITSGKFSMPNHVDAPLEAQEPDDDEEKHVPEDAGEIAADFDIDNSS